MPNIADLVNLFKQIDATKEANEHPTDLKYVIYARKSTEGEERQVRSLSDQVFECKQLAERLKLDVLATPVEEAESAKEPDTRPKFRRLIDDLKNGKFDGIIAWHPDRLARNMKDAGEIIDLIDKQIIKDIKFVSFTFENNTTGKMLLGISFVLSKQYSDQLSDNIKRGIRRSIAEGKWLNKAKHGYFKDGNQLLRPDGENFLIIKNAFKMRLEDKSLEEIAKYLNNSGYTTLTNNTRKAHKFEPKRVGELLKDEIYTGILRYGDEVLNLIDTYNFVPMVSVDEYVKINKLSSITKKTKLRNKFFNKGSIKADFLRGMVTCGYCKQKMVSSITNKASAKGITKYYYYKCDTNRCSFKGKSIRANVVLQFVYDFLENNKLTSIEIYQHYLAEMKKVAKEENKETDRVKRHLFEKVQQCEERIEGIKSLLLGEADGQIKEILKADLKNKDSECKKAKEEIQRIKLEQEAKKGSILSYEKFIELFKDLPLLIRNTNSLEKKNYLIKKIFSNFVLKHGKVASYTLNEPFKGFKESGFIRSGGDERARTSDLNNVNVAL